MTKAKKHVSDLRPVDIPLPSKNAVRRAVNRVNSEMSIITTIIDKLREVYAMSNEDETSTVIDTLEKELDDIENSVDICVAAAEKHLETESMREKQSQYYYQSIQKRVLKQSLLPPQK